MNNNKQGIVPIDTLELWLNKKIKIFMIDNSSFIGFLKSVDENSSNLKRSHNIKCNIFERFRKKKF